MSGSWRRLLLLCVLVTFSPAESSASAVEPASEAEVVLPPFPELDAPRALRTFPDERESGAPFLIVERSRQRATVGEALVVDYLLLVPAMVMGAEILRVEEPVFRGLWFAERSDARGASILNPVGQRDVEGERHDVFLLRSYVVAALETGPIPLPVLRAEVVLRGFFRDEGRLALDSPAPVLMVEAPPDREEEREDAHPAATGRIALRAGLPEGPWRAGETRRFTLDATGLALAAQVSLPLPRIRAQAEVFTSAPRRSGGTSLSEEGWPWMTRSLDLDITPLEAGALSVHLPAIAWFDPWEPGWMEAPARVWHFDVAPAPEGGAAAAVIAAGSPGRADASWKDSLPAAHPPMSASGLERARGLLTPLMLLLVLLGLAPHLTGHLFSLPLKLARSLRRSWLQGRPRRVLRRCARRRRIQDWDPVRAALRSLLRRELGPTADSRPLSQIVRQAREEGQETLAQIAELLRALERCRHGGDLAEEEADLHYRLRTCARGLR